MNSEDKFRREMFERFEKAKHKDEKIIYEYTEEDKQNFIKHCYDYKDVIKCLQLDFNMGGKWCNRDVKNFESDKTPYLYKISRWAYNDKEKQIANDLTEELLHTYITYTNYETGEIFWSQKQIELQSQPQAEIKGRTQVYGTAPTLKTGFAVYILGLIISMFAKGAGQVILSIILCTIGWLVWRRNEIRKYNTPWNERKDK